MLKASLILLFCTATVAKAQKPADPVKTGSLTASKTIKTERWIPTESPVFIGPGNIADFVADSIVYPDSLVNKGIKGTSRISYTIDTSGIVNDVKIKKSSGSKALDDEAVRVVKLFTFKPARAEGRAVEVEQEIPVTFSIDD